MRDDREWSPFERQVAAALHSAQPQPTNTCLEPDDLLTLAEQSEDAPGYKERMAHVAACAFCRPEYVQMRADLLETERLRAALSASSAPTALQTTEPKQQQGTAATKRARVSQPSSLWQRWFAPRVLAPGFAVSALLALISLGKVHSLQQDKARLAGELTQERNQNSVLAKRQSQTPPTPIGSDQSTSDNIRLSSELAEIRKQLQAENAERMKTAARLQRSETLLKENEKLLAAFRKHDNASMVNSNGPHSAPPDTHPANTSRRMEGLDISVSPERMIASAKPSLEQNDLLKQEGGTTRSSTGEALESVELVSPQGAVILEPRPLLRWRPVEGAERYEVDVSEVYRMGNGDVGTKELNWMKVPVRTTATQYQIEHALTPGKVYSWEVTAYRDPKEKPFAHKSAKFLLADAAQAKALKLLADLQFVAGKSLEAQQEWERAESQYRAISSSVLDVYDQAQARIAALEKRRKRQP